MPLPSTRFAPHRRGLRALLLSAALGLSLAGCFSSNPHSEYFIVTFQPGTLDPTVQGAAALNSTVADVSSHGADFAEIQAITANDPGARALAQQRVDRIAQVLVKAGVKSAVIQRDIRLVGDQQFAQSKDDLSVQIGHGPPPRP